MRKQILVGRGFVAALLAIGLAHLAGCSGCGQPQVESVLLVNFNRLTDGQQLAPLDKSDPAAPGFPVDISVQGQDTTGRVVTLQDAKLEVRSNGAADWSAGPSAVLNGANAIFPGTPLGSGTNLLRTTVTEKDSLRQALRTIVVVVPSPIGCAISFTAPASSPFTYNLSFDEDPSTPGLQTTVRGVVQKCQGFPVSLYKGGAGGSLLGTATADVSSGAFSIYITLQDFEQARLTAQMADPFPPNPLSSSFVDVSVKISPPVLTNPLPSIPSPFSTLYYVADSNIYLLQPDAGQPGAGYIRNNGPDVDAVADFGFTVSNADGGMARLVYRGTDVATPVPITSDPQNISWRNAHLPQKTAGLLQLLATDGVGNQTIRSANTTVDVIPPAASAISNAFVPDGGARIAQVNLTWTASGDDGLLGGPPAGYDLRWSTNSVIRPDAGFFDPNQFSQSPGGILPGGSTSTQLSPLPPLNTYLFQVRPFDSVGNYARTSPQSAVPNALSTIALTNPNSNLNGYGLHLAKADFNGDGADDLVVASPCIAPASCSTTLAGTVYVYYGAPVGFGSVRQDLTPTDGQIRFFGADVSTGDVGNIAGDAARPDLLVGQPSWQFGTSQAGRGRVFLYFGRTNAQFDPANHSIEFRGRSGVVTQFGAAAQVIPDINGDGLSEVLISAPFEDRAYLYFGRSESAWQGIRVQDTLVDNVWYVPTSAADRVFIGNPSSFFGRLNGFANVGDISGDGGISFTIPASLDSINNLYLFTGPVVQSLGAGGMADGGMAAQVLNQAAVASTGSLNGFGARAFGNLNLVGGAAKDLVVTHPKANKVYIYPDGSGTRFSNPPQSITGSSNMGSSLSYGDINGDGRWDIVTGENATTFSSVWIFYNRGILNREFDATAGAGFSQSQLTSSTSLGIDVVVGDFNGDGRHDIAAGDHLDGTGKVTVWY